MNIARQIYLHPVGSRLVRALALGEPGVLCVGGMLAGIVFTVEEIERRLTYSIFPGSELRPRDAVRIASTIGQRLPDSSDAIWQRVVGYPNLGPADPLSECAAISEDGQAVRLRRARQMRWTSRVTSFTEALHEIVIFVEEGYLDEEAGIMLFKRTVLLLEEIKRERERMAYLEARVVMSMLEELLGGQSPHGVTAIWL